MMMESSINSATILPPYEEEFEPVDNLHWSPETANSIYLFWINQLQASMLIVQYGGRDKKHTQQIVGSFLIGLNAPKHAICRGRSDSRACNENFPNSHIVLPDKTTVKNSVGKCIRPNVCECKQEGFYSAGSFCNICSPINNCDLEYCTTKTNQRCRRCEGLVADKSWYRAYIISTDKRLCIKSCSWRPDSRCYPGTCRDELFSNCYCSVGFTGTHCNRITAIPDILYNQVTLSADNGETVDAPDGRNGVKTQTVSCTTIRKDNPNQGLLDCTKTIKRTFPVPFQHLEQLSFKITTTIGGFVKIKNLERNVYNTYYYTPNSLSRAFEIKFDNVPPYHCQPVDNCKLTMLTDIDITKKVENTVYWDGWIGEDSGIAKYELEIFSMKSVGNELIIDKRIFDTETTLKSQQFNLTVPGVYSVILAAVDKAGNIRLARRCLIFDDNSQENRYINTKHHNGKYLAGIQDYHGLDPEYDDHYGIRTKKHIDNVQGIVRYETYYGIDDQGGSTIQPTDTDFTTTGNLNQSITISPTLQDGDTVKFYIRAYDIVDFYLEESTTVYFDMSPPVIKDLWLTKGDKVDLAVHGFQDFDKLVIEWIAYDLHSGLETVEWKLYDNFTGDVILHGSQHIPVQGEAQTRKECEEKYQNSPRGSCYCYCTPAVGCYLQHFQVKPGVSLDEGTGLIQGKHQGVHDYDYYIEVYVMNNAKLY
ncbi:hypothetical protein LOTGIDRAFT_165458 [Lottia gigantea]|uniref:EGF-like domain-containing protein n=1 Tax=Lottia gigantea TaxID=225164 RepID=V3ZWB0_LOTGI|nr:hypothetical protein LOTGIDRAFT_165458 [Lottia gigantea]ESO88672.1 hypothetical protein LOTGIDRAFT_165458 [Lottia gigantea]